METINQAVWYVNGVSTILPASFVSNSQVTAVVPASLLSEPLMSQVSVKTDVPQGPLIQSRVQSSSRSCPHSLFRPAMQR